MPPTNLRKALYDELIRRNEDPTKVVNESVAGYIRDEYGVEIDASAHANKKSKTENPQ